MHSPAQHNLSVVEFDCYWYLELFEKTIAETRLGIMFIHHPHRRQLAQLTRDAVVSVESYHNASGVWIESRPLSLPGDSF